MNPKVLVCGYYGFGNSGDEAILSVLIGDLNEVFDQPEITVVAGNIEAIAADHNVDAILWTDVGQLHESARASDLMVLGGGGLFQDQQDFDAAAILTPRHGGMSYWAGFALLSHLVEKPLAIYGVGVGPLTTDEGKRLTIMSFRAAAAVSVRDRESSRLLDELGIHDVPVTADPAFRMTTDRAIGREILANEHIPLEEPLVAVGIRSWADDGFVAGLAEQLDRLVASHDARIVFVPFQTSPHRAENDPAAALRVLTAMEHGSRAAILRGTYTPEDKMAVQSAAGVVIGMRLHSVIMAAAAGVPVVALAYDPKVVNTMKSLGVGEMTLDLADIGSLAEKVGWALSDPGYGSAIRDRVLALVSRAGLNERVLAEALERHRVVEDPIVREASRLALQHLEIGARLQDQEVLSRQLTRLQDERDKLQAEWDHLVGSRSMRVVNSWWSIRNRLRRGQAEADVDSEFRRRYQAELDEILDTHKEAAGIVVYPPTIGWAAQLFQRPQQMARAFARMGYLTFFGVDWGGPEGVRGFRYEGDRLCLTGLPVNLLPILDRIPNPLMVSYVYNFEFRKYLSNPTTIFEHIDHLDVFTSSFPMDRLGSWFDEAARDADVVAASARDLQVEMLPRRADTILCPNGVTFEHFAGYRPGPVPSDLAEIVSRGRPIVGYYGAIAEWVDYDLLEHAAENLPDYSFVFIGPNYDNTMDQAAVFKRPNVWWLGPKSYDVLPGYLHHFSVTTIPFKVNDVTHGVSPLKLFEYMAGGKPVVTTAMREAQHYEQVLVAHDPEEWVKLLVEGVALERDPAFVSSLQRTARANTWDQRVGTLIDAASKTS
jgi:teichuronic acid biosynthesis glycosyltransferase TuaH